MATVKPFLGLRPHPEYAERVAAFPYDVVNSEEARVLAEGNPYSFLRVSKPEINLAPSVHQYDEIVYKTGAAQLRQMIADGVLIREDVPAFYVYRQKMGEHEQVGLVGCASCDEYDRDIIKKHEFTRADKEEDRVRHVVALNANSGPVFLSYRSLPDVDALIMDVTRETPLYHFTKEDQITHTFWLVKDPEKLQAIEKAFSERVPVMYVADGHHRSASAARVGRMRRESNPCHTGQEEYNLFLAVMFPHNQLKIMDYNRVVKDLNGLSKEQFIEKIGEKFTVSTLESPRPAGRRHISMYLDGSWHGLVPKPGTYPENDPVHSLDVSILQENLLAPVLGILDPRRDNRIDFVGGIRGLGELEKRVANGWAVAFAMNPTSMDELMAIADSGNTMPPKSTWFEPKLRSGLVLHSLD